MDIISADPSAPVTAPSYPNAARIEEILRDCLFWDSELPGDGSTPEGAVIAQSVRGSFGFHPDRLVSHKAEIRKHLDGLPIEFQDTSVEGGGGGWSFLNACMDRQGSLWGQHTDINNLLALGIATQQAKFLMRRELWDVFPSGMPYFVVLPPTD